MLRTDRRQIVRGAHGEEMRAGDAERREQPCELVLDDVGERARHQQARAGVRVLLRKRGNERGETGILALGESRLDAAAGIGDDPRAGRMGG